ncbi:DUF5789 family protein [Halalkalicoccus subterraneus]|uniref:DUF5789 family protein n=1 Tax=Halalkalicoccus subterraneus TaxID=2675002 RepID=UPI000EFB30B7|nr:hypothetical protein [Halalkalicoccus subterraneus]
MTQPEPTDRTREQGIEFGALAEELTTVEYPADCTELIDTYGDESLQLPNGSQSFRNVLEPLEGERFDSSEDVRQAVIGLVNKKAIGREGYSDRTPPAPGEEHDRDPESF